MALPPDIAAVARTLGVVDQTLFNRVEAGRQGTLILDESAALQRSFVAANNGVDPWCDQARITTQKT